MKVLVTGGTGFVGQEIVRELVARQHLVRLLVRDPYAPAVTALGHRHPLELRQADLQARAQLEEAAEGVEAIVHLVGIIGEIGPQTFERLHTRATQNLVLAAQARGVRRFVHMSALGTRPAARSRYHRTKWEAEEAVRRSGLDFTIFRPSLIYGPRDHFVNQFDQISRFSPLLPVLGPGTARMTPIPVEDVARCFVQALEEPRSLGRTFDLGGPALTFNEILDAILRVRRRRRWKVHVPWPVARGLAATMEFLTPRLLRRAAPLNRDQLLMLQEDNEGDTSAAREIFGIRAVPFEDGIRRYLIG